MEQINKTYLKTHGLDNRGYLYKINFFEWFPYDEIKLETDPDYDEKAFEEYLEIKGNTDNSKLIELIDEVNDYSIPIEEIVEEHFDIENMCYWIAFHILTGNYDVGSRNYYLYSPQNSDKWYFISWDNDAAFSRTEYRLTDYTVGQSWEQGYTQFMHTVLFNRIFREEEYRDMLTNAVEDLRENHLTEEKISSMAEQYAAVTRDFLYRQPDEENAKLGENQFDLVVSSMDSEIEENYGYYLESLEKPLPFYVGTPYEMDGNITVTWDAAYDLDGEMITYSFMAAKDYEFTEVIYSEDNIVIPEASFQMQEPGMYFIRVRARNESGAEQDCYDYYTMESGGKAYGAKAFTINEDGSITDVIEEG